MRYLLNSKREFGLTKDEIENESTLPEYEEVIPVSLVLPEILNLLESRKLCGDRNKDLKVECSPILNDLISNAMFDKGFEIIAYSEENAKTLWEESKLMRNTAIAVLTFMAMNHIKEQFDFQKRYVEKHNRGRFFKRTDASDKRAYYSHVANIDFSRTCLYGFHDFLYPLKYINELETNKSEFVDDEYMQYVRNIIYLQGLDFKYALDDIYASCSALAKHDNKALYNMFNNLNKLIAFGIVWKIIPDTNDNFSLIDFIQRGNGTSMHTMMKLARLIYEKENKKGRKLKREEFLKSFNRSLGVLTKFAKDDLSISVNIMELLTINETEEDNVGSFIEDQFEELIGGGISISKVIYKHWEMVVRKKRYESFKRNRLNSRASKRVVTFCPGVAVTGRGRNAVHERMRMTSDMLKLLNTRY